MMEHKHENKTDNVCGLCTGGEGVKPDGDGRESKIRGIQIGIQYEERPRGGTGESR